jgi:diguanylate cyclase (GGDEF)-like protein/PAS domain S-box-containing protein
MADRTPAGPPAPHVTPRSGAGNEAAAAFEGLLQRTGLLPNLHYWEYDAQHRLVRVIGPQVGAVRFEGTTHLGKTLREMGGTLLGMPGGWPEVDALFERRESFTELVVRYTSASGTVRFIAHTGEPRVDAAGRFIGYHGVFRDVTRRATIERRQAAELAISRLLAQAPSVDAAAGGVVEALLKALDWQCGAFWHLDAPDAAPRRAAAPLGHTLPLPPAGAPGHAQDPLCRALAEGGAQPVADLAALPADARLDALRAAGLRSAWVVPVPIDGHIAGAIELFGPRVERPDAQMTACADHVAAALGQYIQRHRLDAELRQFRAALDALPDMVYLVDRDAMRFLYANERACQAAGCSAEEHLAIGPQDLLLRRREDIEADYDALIAHPGQGSTIEFVARDRDGRRKAYIEAHSRAMDIGGRRVVLTVSRDVTARKLAERSARRMSRMYAALSATNEAIVHADTPQRLFDEICAAAVEGGGFVMAAIMLPEADGSARCAAVCGAHADKMRDSVVSLEPGTPEGRGLIGIAFRTLEPCISHDFLADERTRPWHAIAGSAGVASGGAFPLLREGRALGVLILYSNDRRGFDDEVLKLLSRMAENVAFALDNIERDEERRAGQERISYLASHDALTGLPNRVMFGELLGRAITTAQRYERKFAVMFVDLDRFKLINDSLGHAAGDQLLKEIAQRLADCLRASDVVARMGGDEFVVLVQEVDDAEQVAVVARKILSATLRPVELLGQESRVTGSVGIAVYPTDATDEQGLMKCADMAMYKAKDEGKNNFQFFSPDIRSHSLERMALETNLRNALERGELSLHYQPQIDIRSNAITGVEALLRWDSPTLGMVPPSQFIPLAEETGFIVPIGRWVLRTACAQSAAWQREGLAPVCVAVNLSARQFAEDGLVDDVAEALRLSGIAPQLLELEITEGMVIASPERALDTLSRIKAMGVRLAIDDFGTGYSSLAQLKNFPVDTLKVDRSFIRDLAANADDRAITEAIISMGKSLSLNVVAEGVETLEQLDILRASACDEMQGFYFSKAVTADAFGQLMKGHRAR